MSRRNYQKAGDGKLFCIEWPEWHIRCAQYEECSQDLLVAPCGEAETIRKAQTYIDKGKTEDPMGGWAKGRDGLWYCPKHLI